jgi:hypothetical protein
MYVQMELSRILIRERRHEQIIELRETDPEDGESARSFPIVIGIVEADAIRRRLEHIELPRPMTHDLLGSIIEGLGATLDAISIVDLVDGAFIARLNVSKENGERVAIDARPSDAIALGAALDVPIFVAEHVIEQAVLKAPGRSDE